VAITSAFDRCNANDGSVAFDLNCAPMRIISYVQRFSKTVSIIAPAFSAMRLSGNELRLHIRRKRRIRQYNAG
jgi:hypothetical protein